MQIEINGKRNITLDFNAPKKFKLVKDGAEIPYIRTGKNSFRLSKPVEGFVELEEIVEHPRYMQPVQLQPQQMTVINPQDVDRLNEAVRQMALVNPQDVMIINQTAEQLEKNQNFIAQTQKEITDNQVYIDQQQQRLNETALGIQALETNNSQRLDGAENAILNLAGEISNAQNMAIDGINTTLNKIEEQGILLQAEIDTKADKEELETLRKDFEEKSDQFSNAMSSYSGGFAYDTLPQNGEAGQILAKRTDRQGDYIWIDQTPVIVKSETIPTASEKYKGEVYQYVGETGDYTHGYIYECQQNGTSYEWVRLDVQPNHSTEIESLTTRVGNLETGKQDKLTQTQMDAVNSGANQSNIAQITTNQSNINTINGKIPAQASSENQLADKEFVNSSISTNTANFIGTFASISDLESYSGTVTNNDYAFVVNRVVTDNGNDWATFTALNAYDKTLLSNFDYAWVINGANFDLYRFDIINQVWDLRATAIEKSSVTLNSAYNRYKAVVSGSTTWTYEYTLNNSSFTASQWSAINSGITDDLVAEFEAKGALLDYTGNTLTLEDSDGNALSSVTIQSSPDLDNKSITKNSSDELQTVGVINSRDTSTAIKTWTGTRQQYDALKTAHTMYEWVNGSDKAYTTTRSATTGDLVYNSSYELIGTVYIDEYSSPYITIYVGEPGPDQLSFDRLESDTSTVTIYEFAGDSNTLYNITDTGEIYLGSTIISNYGADTSLSNLSSTGQAVLNTKQDVATAVNYNNISNCITEIPQDIKLELNNGTLTLKAGSKLYYPDGLDSNNNPKFTTRITTSDYVANGQYGYEVAPHILCLNNASYWVTPNISIVFSGTTAPTGYQFMLWYDTANNIVKWTNNSGSTWNVQDCSLPFGIATYNGGSYENGFKQIDQIFNGFGYIGSTVFALPGVKGLIPNGRNADGTLKNIEFTSSQVWTRTWTSNPNYHDISLATTGIGLNTNTYNEEENFVYNAGGAKVTDRVVFGRMEYNSSSPWNITSLQVKTAFHAVDYNDSSTISGWSMPSSRYIDLTLGASGATYTAPANGWFMIAKATSAANQYVLMSQIPNRTSTQCWCPVSGQYAQAYIPIKKGDTCTVTYSAAGTLAFFRFIYAEGEN